MNKNNTRFKILDAAEIVIGSVMLGFPITVTEEVWILGRDLPIHLILLIAIASLGFIGLFVYARYHISNMARTKNDFYIRTLAVYVITLVVSSLLLALVEQFPLFSEPLIAIKRCIIVSLPASFAATMVDSIGHSVEAK